VQQEEQGGAAQEVDDDEGRQRPERVGVVDAGEPPRAPERLPGPHSLGDHRGHREPGEGEPGKGGQDEEPDEQADRQEDQDSHSEGDQIVARRPAPPEDEHARSDEAEREERRAEDEQCPLSGPAGPDRELVEDGDDEPDREPAPEVPLVETDRVGDELTNGPVGRRDVVWERRHRAETLSPSDYERPLFDCKRLDQLFLEPGEIAVNGEVATTRLGQVELLVVEVLRDVEARAEDEPQVVERSQPGVGLLGSERVPAHCVSNRRQRLHAAGEKLVPDERPVLLLVLAIRVSRGKEPAQGRILWVFEERLELVEQLAQKRDLVRLQVQAHLAVDVALDLPREVHLVPLPVMPPSLWVASTKPEAALGRGQGLQPWQGRGWTLAPRDRGPEAGMHCRKGH